MPRWEQCKIEWIDLGKKGMLGPEYSKYIAVSYMPQRVF
jgi:hypothetical protein